MTMLAQVATPTVVWSLLWPLLFFSLGPILMLTLVSVVPAARNHRIPAVVTAGLSVAALVSLVPIWNRVTETEGPRSVVGGALEIDAFTLTVMGVIAVAVLLTTLFLDDYLVREGLAGPEWYALLLLSASGGMILAAASDLIVAFLGLEILSIAVYVLAALHLRRTESQEAGFKYFILGALASALFLYGIALTYGATGALDLAGIASAGGSARGLDPAVNSSMILAAMALLLVGFAFKVSAAPFHVWTPDVYQGSPTPVVAYMATGVKIAGFAGFARVFVNAFGDYVADWQPMVAALAILTLLIGSIAALVQTNVKRMLAYSSINHAGFMLVALYAAWTQDGEGLLGREALVFYFGAYTLMAAGTFGVFTGASRRGDDHHDLDDYRGLASRQPVMAVLLAILMFAQAGIPFTVGFLAKLRVILAAVDVGGYWLAGAAMLAAVISAVVYLRIVASVFLSEAPEASDDDEAPAPLPANAPPLVMVGVAAAAVLTIVLGVAPGLVEGILDHAGQALGELTR